MKILTRKNNNSQGIGAFTMTVLITILVLLLVLVFRLNEDLSPSDFPFFQTDEKKLPFGGKLNVDCENYFSKDAKKIAEKKDSYLSPKHFAFTDNGDYDALFFLGYTQNEFLMFAKVISDEEICVENNAFLGIKFEKDDQYIYVERGMGKGQCVPGRKVDERKYATSIHTIHINSLMFKHMVNRKIEGIGIGTNKGTIAVTPVHFSDSDEMKNAFQCAYLALGKKIDLTQDSALIDNRHIIPSK